MALYEQLLDKMDGRQYSNYFLAYCPFHHNVNTPSFFVYESGDFRCASCHKYGTLEYLAKFIGHKQFSMTQSQSKVQVLPQWRRWVQQWDGLEGIVEHAHNNIRKHSIDKYLKRRKIYDFMEKGRLGVLDGWLVVPVFSHDARIMDVVVRKLSSSSSTRYVVQPICVSDRRPLFVPNWQRLDKAETIYCVFGILDAISLELCGLPVVTGITGKAVPVELLQDLHKRVIIVPDLDEEKEAHMIANKLGWRGRVKELKYPDGCKDPNDVLMFQGKEELVSLLQ